MQPKSSDIEDAKRFLRSRINAEVSMKNHLQEYFYEAAKRIVAISYRYGTTPSQFRFSRNVAMMNEIIDVINWLKEIIEYAMDTLASFNEKDDEDKNLLLLTIKGKYKGKTFEQRFDDYIERYQLELETAIAAGLLLNHTEESVVKAIKVNMRHPYSNPIIKDAIEEGGGVQSILAGGKPNYGVGHTNSALTGIEDLTRWIIASGWMASRDKKMIKSGAIGFMSYRGSSYPCAQCDDETTYVHQFGVDPHPPYHNHCKCFTVPIYM